MFDELVQMTPEEAGRKIASVAVVARDLRKRAFDLPGAVTSGLSNVGGMLANGNPLATAGLGALTMGGLGAAREMMRDPEERRWGNAMMAGALGGALGGAAPSIVQGAKSLMTTPEGRYPGTAPGEGGGGAARPTLGSALDMAAAPIEAAGSAVKGLSSAAEDTLGNFGGGIVGAAGETLGNAMQAGPFTTAGAAGSGLLAANRGGAQLADAWTKIRGNPELAKNTLRDLVKVQGMAPAEVSAMHRDGTTLMNRQGPGGAIDRLMASRHGIPRGGAFSWKERLLPTSVSGVGRELAGPSLGSQPPLSRTHGVGPTRELMNRGSAGRPGWLSALPLGLGIAADTARYLSSSQ